MGVWMRAAWIFRHPNLRLVVKKLQLRRLRPMVLLRVLKMAQSLDLDGDGNEETGWVIVYLHIATEGRVPVGTCWRKATT